MRTPTSIPTLTALAAAGALVLVGCSEPDDEPGPDGTRDIDARAYYDDYETQADDLALAMPESASADDGGGGPVPIPGPTEDNTFVDAGTSGFVDPRQDPLSTFALDVDTGSYGVARSLLEQGYRPPPASVRVEEWVNAMEYDDPAPTDADLGVVAESSSAPGVTSRLEADTQLVRVGVSAREVQPSERARVNVTLVVDRSGSMDIRDRLGLVQSSLALLADRLAGDDTVSVVSFEDQARPILEPTPVRDTGEILDAIEELKPGGSTNLEAGLRLGYEQAREGFDADAVNLVVLASDGVANVGATGPGSITEKIAEEGRDGIHLVTVGYGMGNYNDHLMEQLADLGDGFYSYVDTYGEAEQLFGTDLTTTLTPVAAEARTQVAFDPELVTSYRLVGYDNREIADDDFDDLSVDAGELGAGHHATALYEVRLADGVAPGTPIGEATVKWEGVSDGRGHVADTELVAADPEATPSHSLALASTVADLAQVLKDAAWYRDRDVDLPDIGERAKALGADEIVDLVRLAEESRLYIG
ncbi:MAG: von Willebrand factor type A domain-containing protein [Nocardioides sp.]